MKLCCSLTRATELCVIRASVGSAGLSISIARDELSLALTLRDALLRVRVVHLQRCNATSRASRSASWRHVRLTAPAWRFYSVRTLTVRAASTMRRRQLAPETQHVAIPAHTNIGSSVSRPGRVTMSSLCSARSMPSRAAQLRLSMRLRASQTPTRVTRACVKYYTSNADSTSPGTRAILLYQLWYAGSECRSRPTASSSRKATRFHARAKTVRPLFEHRLHDQVAIIQLQHQPHLNTKQTRWHHQPLAERSRRRSGRRVSRHERQLSGSAEI